MTKTEKTFVWMGGLVLGVLAVGGVAYAATHHKPSAANPTPASLTTSTTWDTGKNYLFAANVPSGMHDADSLIKSLAANGWTNIVILYFGPTGSVVANTKLPFTVDSGMYAASGTWGGAAGYPIPSGVSSVNVP
jgi:hypothetical protein